MGGNALKQGCVRISPRTYRKVLTRIMEGLCRPEYPEYGEVPGKYGTPRSYGSKESFGDIDVVHTGFLCSSAEVDSLLKSKFLATEIVRNGPCISFDFHCPNLGVEIGEGKGVQVDLIEVKDEHFEFALGYYSYNDLGSLIGVIAKAHGFKFGHDGLYYRYDHNDSNQVSLVPCTKDYGEAVEFLGFHLGTINTSTLENIFEYVYNSDFFDVSLFQLDALNHTNRTRNSKRFVYMEFLKWLETKQYKKPSVVPDLLKKACAEFSGFEKEFHNSVASLFLKEQVKEVYNGSIVFEWTGLEGKELGELMKATRDYYASDTLLQLDALYSPLQLKAVVISQLLRLPNVRSQAVLQVS